jgi:hypothetical protein
MDWILNEFKQKCTVKRKDIMEKVGSASVSSSLSVRSREPVVDLDSNCTYAQRNYMKDRPKSRPCPDAGRHTSPSAKLLMMGSWCGICSENLRKGSSMVRLCIFPLWIGLKFSQGMSRTSHPQVQWSGYYVCSSIWLKKTKIGYDRLSNHVKSRIQLSAKDDSDSRNIQPLLHTNPRNPRNPSNSKFTWEPHVSRDHVQRDDLSKSTCAEPNRIWLAKWQNNIKYIKLIYNIWYINNMI